MELAALTTYMLAKPATTQEQPFGPEVLVFKVVGKMYALVAWQDTPLSLSLKCNPDLAQSLRATYPAITPGYHLNKEHWNTLLLDGSIPEAEVLSLIDHSYELVVKGLKKSERAKLGQL
ncbi:MAG: putative protein YjbR [Anaerolineae bacterium]|nr:putative protein YjbR [Anaerolineae bacterium]